MRKLSKAPIVTPARRVPRKKAAPPAEPPKKGWPETRKDWTKEDDRIVRKYYPTKGSGYTAEQLGRTRTSVQHRALRLGLTSSIKRAWTKKELALLRTQYPKVSAIKIARTLNRTELSVRGQIHQMGLADQPSEQWTDAEMKYLRSHYGKVSVAELADELGRTNDAVELKAGRMGLRRKIRKLSAAETRQIVKRLGTMSLPKIAEQVGLPLGSVRKVAAREGFRSRATQRPWTAKEDATMRKHYGTMSRKEMAALLDRTTGAVGMRAQMLGLTGKPRPHLQTTSDRTSRTSAAVTRQK